MAKQHAPESEGVGKSSDTVQWHRVRLWQIQAVRDVLLILAAFALLWLGAQLSVVTVPLLVGLGLAYLVEPIITRLSYRFAWASRPRVIASLVAIMVLGGAFLSVISIPRLINQTNELVRNRAVYAERFEELLQNDWVPESVREYVGPSLSWFAASLADVDAPALHEPAEPYGRETDVDRGDDAEGKGSANTESEAESEQRSNAQSDHESSPVEGFDREQLRELIREELAGIQDPALLAGEASGVNGQPPVSQLQRVLSTALTLFGGVINAFMFTFLSLFFFVFVSLSYPKVIQTVWSLTPVARRQRLRYLAQRMDSAVSGFVRGRLIICGFMAVAYGIGWSIFGVPHALVLALVTGILGLIPFAAGLMLPLAWILLAVGVGTGSESFWYHDEAGAIRWWAVLVLPGLVFAVVQVMDDYVLTPIIQGKTTNLDAVSIVVALIAGGSLAGLYGMLLAIPVAACVRIVLIEVVMPQIKAWSEGRRIDPLPVDDQST